MSGHREPAGLHARQTNMKRLGSLPALVLSMGLLVGCGSAGTENAESGGQGDKADATGVASSTVGKCSGDSPAVANARTVARVDLDGDGTAEVVKLTAGGGECANTVFAKTGEGFVSSAPVDG